MNICWTSESMDKCVIGEKKVLTFYKRKNMSLVFASVLLLILIHKEMTKVMTYPNYS